jgi:hypothetical protein
MKTLTKEAEMATTLQPQANESKEGKQELTNKKYKIDIYADDSGGTLEFYLQPGNEDTREHMRGKKLGFPNGPDWYDIEYKLDDDDSSIKVKFKQAEPICVAPGTVCPVKGSGNGSNGQISVDSPKENKKLRIKNKNQNVEKFSYTLFFTDLNDKDVGELDPIYDNGGGGHQLQ